MPAALGTTGALLALRRLDRSAEGAQWRDLLSTIRRLFAERRSLDCARDDGDAGCARDDGMVLLRFRVGRIRMIHNR
jgi:hypothetical protein